MDEFDEKGYIYGEKQALYLINKHLNIIQKSSGKSALDSFSLAFCRAEEEIIKKNPYDEHISRQFHIHNYSGYTEDWFRQNFDLNYETYIEKFKNINDALKNIELTKEEKNFEKFGKFLPDFEDI